MENNPSPFIHNPLPVRPEPVEGCLIFKRGQPLKEENITTGAQISLFKG